MYKELVLQDKWFGASVPRNPKKATATLTFTDVAVVTETVTIGTEVYEFCTATATEGNIAVVLGGTVTADNAVTKLAEAINTNSDLATAVASTTNDTVVVSYISVGTAGNAITVEETCTNASWGESVTALSGGQLGTPCSQRDVLVYVSPYYYWCTQEGGESTVVWQRFTPATY